MVEMVDKTESKYVFLDTDTNAKFRFKINDKSSNFGIYYTSKKYPAPTSLGTIIDDLYENKHRRAEAQRTVEIIYELSENESEFINYCKNIFGKRIHTERLDIPITFKEKELLEGYLEELRKNGD